MKQYPCPIEELVIIEAPDRDEAVAIWNVEVKKYPSLCYGTHVRTHMNEDGSFCYEVVRWESSEVCLRHCIVVDRDID